jgi:hypothetical protein
VENALEFDFRVRFDLTANDIVKIIHAITWERAILLTLGSVAAWV